MGPVWNMSNDDNEVVLSSFIIFLSPILDLVLNTVICFYITIYRTQSVKLLLLLITDNIVFSCSCIGPRVRLVSVMRSLSRSATGRSLFAALLHAIRSVYHIVYVGVRSY